MMKEKPTQREYRGERIIRLLQGPKNLEGAIRFKDVHTELALTDEDGKAVEWTSFVTFPHELSASFPGSVIRPDIFLNKLGEDSGNIRNLLNNDKDAGSSFEHKDIVGNFELTVLHGSTSKYAMNLMRLANQGFADESVRAQYQQAIIEAISPTIKNSLPPNYGLRIHDDCLASGDSILSYLELQMRQGNEEVLRKGVEVLIDGPSTAQGVLLLRAYARKHKIPLHITSGYMAYGLSEGKQIFPSGPRQHANYITMPDEVIKMLSEDKQRFVRGLAAGDGNIYVVGDMGDAEKGISQPTIDKMRAELNNLDYCAINDIRKDSHGNHPMHDTLERMDGPLSQDTPNDVYFARGGYLPYALDNLYSMFFSQSKKTILKASRKWTKEYGYGATFRPTD
ncbi:MAG: hypothetical protein WA061_01275 [Microgenomates group bacterium]